MLTDTILHLVIINSIEKVFLQILSFVVQIEAWPINYWLGIFDFFYLAFKSRIRTLKSYAWNLREMWFFPPYVDSMPEVGLSISMVNI